MANSKIDLITKNDLLFLKDVNDRNYSDNSMASNSTPEERKKLSLLRNKLKSIAAYYNTKYKDLYGPFETNVSSGNPIAIGQKKLNRVWAGISKGAENKQYSAQISFVLNPNTLTVELGFYFGRVSAHKINNETKIKFENQLKRLGEILSREIQTDDFLKKSYGQLFDYGFHASIINEIATPQEWLQAIEKKPNNCQLIFPIPFDENGIIELSTFDANIAMIIPFMNVIPSHGVIELDIKRDYKPLTALQRAKQAERYTLIGEKGELIALQFEKERLAKLNISTLLYPSHVSLKSTTYGYDILSCDEDNNEIFIEVKSTTRLKEDHDANKFHLSTGEYEFYMKNKNRFYLYRVIDTEGSPEIQIINMEGVKITAEGYLLEYK